MMLMGISFFGIGAVSGLLLGRKSRFNKGLPLIMAGVGSGFFLALALKSLLLGVQVELLLPTGLPFGPFILVIDKLAAFFVLLTSLMGLLVSLYSWGYLEGLREKHNLGYVGFLYNLFLLSMFLVVTVANGFWFLVVWEVMSVASLLLVLVEHQLKEVRQAGFIYGVMTHFGTAFIIVAFMILFIQAGTFDFSSFRAISQNLDLKVAGMVFVASTIGFSTKAGVIPLHVWLPRAHPAAPSNISALMSGVMVKTAIYGMLRLYFDLLPTGPSWWGISLIFIGIVSALLGVIYTIVQRDIKKLLAYSTVENMGILFTAIGLALFFSAKGLDNWAVFAMVAVFYHALNHAVFKGLLFMGAGSVLHVTHTKDMEKLGGLIHKMPYTSLFMLVGVLAVMALPPLNGFIGEWLLFQALLGLSWNSLGAISYLAGPILITILALTGGLVLASFVRMYGITFLALPRSPEARDAVEVPGTMTSSMGFCAAICILLGIFPVFVVRILSGISLALIGGQKLTSGNLLEQLTMTTGQIYPLVIWASLILLVPVIVIVTRLLGGKTIRRRAETWSCGVSANHSMEYTGTAFAEPLRIIFARVLQPQRQVSTNGSRAPYFSNGLRYREKVVSVVEIYLYRPVMSIFYQTCKYVRWMQTGNLHTYLTYMFITLVLVLLFAR